MRMLVFRRVLRGELHCQASDPSRTRGVWGLRQRPENFILSAALLEPLTIFCRLGVSALPPMRRCLWIQNQKS